MKYFAEVIDYPRDILNDFLPVGTQWNYVPSTLLLGLINHVKIIKAQAVGHYSEWDEFDEDPSPLYIRSEIPNELWTEVAPKTPNERFEILARPGIRCHPKIIDWGQDVVLLTSSNKHDNSVVNPVYILFWFDQDCSDCSIGRFITDDTSDQVLAEFEHYVQTHPCNLYGAREIPPHAFQAGWLS
jgi:hypothetical protein